MHLEFLAHALLTVIQTEEQNDRMIELKEKPGFAESRTPEQEGLSDLLTLLIEDFEEKHYALKPTTPISMLKSAGRIWAEGSASQALAGKREFPKEHIRKLAKRQMAKCAQQAEIHAGTSGSGWHIRSNNNESDRWRRLLI